MHDPRTHAGIAVALTIFAVLGLAVAPAGAQSLSGFVPGDSVTVSSTGTHGTLGGNAINNATTTYTGTTAPGATVTLNDGTFTLASGGTLSGGLTIDGLDVNLGTASGGGVGVATATITGGTISGFDGVNIGASTVTITGGVISTTVPATGAGLVAQLSTSNLGSGGTINLYGTNFLVNNLPAPSHLTVTTTTLTGLVSGTLANGDKLNTNYQLVGPGSTINFLAPTPEPSQTAALALGTLGLSVLALRARRRTRA